MLVDPRFLGLSKAAHDGGNACKVEKTLPMNGANESGRTWSPQFY